jgi:hypothetical protein
VADTFDSFVSVDALTLQGTSLVAGSLTTVFQEADTGVGNFQTQGACGGQIHSMARRGDDLFLGTTSGNVYHFDFEQGFSDYSFVAPNDAVAMVFDGTHLLIGGSDGTIARVNRITGAVLATFETGMPISSMAIAPDLEEHPGTAYCFGVTCPCGNDDGQAGCENSIGAGARLFGSGTTSVSADDLVLTAEDLPSGTLTKFYMSQIQNQNPFGDGFVCAGGGGYPAFRFPNQSAGLGGVASQGPGIVQFSIAAFPATGHITAGSTWNFQTWYRNVVGPCGGFINFTNGYSVTFGL